MAYEITTSYRNSTVRNWNSVDVNHLETDIIRSGIANLSGDGTDCKVIQTTPASANVEVSVGRVYITGVDDDFEDPHTERLEVRTKRTLTVPANATGDIRVDAIIVRDDVDAEPDAEADNNGTAEILTGDGNTALSDADIITAVGGDGWYRLANINTPNGFTTIQTSDISDTREPIAIQGTDLIISDTYKIRGEKSDASIVDLMQMGVDGADEYVEFVTAFPRIAAALGDPTDDQDIPHKKYVDDLIAAVQGVPYAFVGDGSDNAANFTDDTNLDPTAEYNYTTFTLAVTKTLSVSSVNRPLVVKIQGNATWNGILDLNRKGGAGGAPSGKLGTPATNGSDGKSLGGDTDIVAGGGTAGQDTAEAGAGGASILGNGATTSSGGIPSAGGILNTGLLMLASLLRGIVCGGGGGGGVRSSGSNNPTKGGDGGGAALIVIGGDLTLGADSEINANGAAGGNYASDSGHGGGGGGGCVVVIVFGSITNNGVALSAAAGAAGSGGGGAAGAGKKGKVIIYSMLDGTFIAS